MSNFLQAHFLSAAALFHKNHPPAPVNFRVSAGWKLDLPKTAYLPLSYKALHKFRLQFVLAFLKLASRSCS
jgi:hypothetical protein